MTISIVCNNNTVSYYTISNTLYIPIPNGIIIYPGEKE